MTQSKLGYSEATGEICYDLPSPYLPHRATGLLHLPRFLAKIRKHLTGELPKSYQRNFCKGFDRFLCLHLGVEPEAVEIGMPVEVTFTDVGDGLVLPQFVPAGGDA